MSLAHLVGKPLMPSIAQSSSAHSPIKADFTLATPLRQLADGSPNDLPNRLPQQHCQQSCTRMRMRMRMRMRGCAWSGTPVFPIGNEALVGSRSSQYSTRKSEKVSFVSSPGAERVFSMVYGAWESSWHCIREGTLRALFLP